MKKVYLSSEINEAEIAAWRPSDSILISSPTGSGKTHFVLKKLFPKAVELQKHIIYFCNRKILNEQLHVKANDELFEFFGKVDGVSEDQLQLFHIVTYQYCETSRRFSHIQIPVSDTEKVEVVPENTLYYIFDEAHYFLSDALFNSGTCFWIDKIPTKGINVFLTATPEPLLYFLAVAMNRFDFEKQLCNIHLKFKEKYECRREMEDSNIQRVIQVDMKSGSAVPVITKKYTQREIAATCREIDIYSDCNKTICGLMEKLDVKRLPQNRIDSDNSRFDVFYFHEYVDIFEQMQNASSNDKWLVFVDKERDGIALEARLSQAGIYCVFLCKSTVQRKGIGKETYSEIVKTGRFQCSVLIATEIVDCGVSIHDYTVKHIVLSHSRKTTFLQMLGRKRLSDDESHIRLYVKNYTAREIYGLTHRLYEKLRALTDFALRNSYDYEKRSDATENSDGLRERLLLSRHERERAITEIFTPSNYALVHRIPPKNSSKSFFEIDRFAHGKGDVLEEYEYSKTAFISLIYELSLYMEALKNYQETKNPFFYLEQQLSWIEKKYHEENWVNWEVRRKEILTYLSQSSNIWMNKQEQLDFSEQCLELLLKLPVPPSCLEKEASRYSRKKSKVPGLNILNKSLKEKNIPYKIISRQKYKPNRVSCWCVIDTDLYPHNSF